MSGTTNKPRVVTQMELGIELPSADTRESRIEKRVSVVQRAVDVARAFRRATPHLVVERLSDRRGLVNACNRRIEKLQAEGSPYEALRYHLRRLGYEREWLALEGLLEGERDVAIRAENEINYEDFCRQMADDLAYPDGTVEKLWWQDHWIVCRSEHRSDGWGNMYQGLCMLGRDDPLVPTREVWDACVFSVSSVQHPRAQRPGFASLLDAKVWCERQVAALHGGAKWQTETKSWI